MKTLSFGSLILSLLLVACGEDRAPITPNSIVDSRDQVTFSDLKISLKDPNDRMKPMADAINAGKPISFKALSAELLQQHIDAKKLEGYTTEKLRGFVEGIAKDQKVDDLHALKIENDKRIVAATGKEISYNRDAVTLVDLATQSKMQCYSGSAFFQSVLRQLQSGRDFESRNYVLIYEEGHILPGYVKEGNLIGIETTAEGRAEISYGPAKDIKGAIKVVDAGFWVVVEIFKFRVTNTDSMAAVALNYTAKKYGIDLKNYSFTTPVGAAAKGEPDALNSSPFAFGHSNVPAGDQKRTKIDKQPRSLGNPARVAPALVVPEARPRALDEVFSMEEDEEILRNLKEQGVRIKTQKFLMELVVPEEESIEHSTLLANFTMDIVEDNLQRASDSMRPITLQFYRYRPVIEKVYDYEGADYISKNSGLSLADYTKELITQIRVGPKELRAESRDDEQGVIYQIHWGRSGMTTPTSKAFGVNTELKIMISPLENPKIEIRQETPSLVGGMYIRTRSIE